jgi:hypothetical protein
MTQVFIGLGPNGHSVAAEDIAAMVAKHDRGAALAFSRGTFATFAASSPRGAEAIIQGINGQRIGDVRLVARLDRGSEERSQRRPDAAGSYQTQRQGGYQQRHQHQQGGEASSGSLFVGLGPNAGEVTAEALTALVSQFATPLSVSMRPSFAIVAVDPAQAQAVIDGLSGQYIGNARLSARPDRQSGEQQQQQQQRGARQQERPQQHHDGPVNSKRLYVGLGPNGSRVAPEALRAACEAIAPVTNVEVERFCAFVDVARDADGQAIIDGLTGQTLHGCRLVVRHCRD